MTIIYNCTGERRKELVKAISEITCEASKYLRMPTKAYEIGDFTVDKDGNLNFDDMTDSEEVEQLLENLYQRGFEAEPIENEMDEPDPEETEPVEAEPIENEMDEPDPEETEPEETEPEETEPEETEPEETEPEEAEPEETEPEEAEPEEAEPEEPEPEETEPEEAEPEETEQDNEPYELTVEMPEEAFDEKTFKNLDQIIENRRELFCHALKTDSLEYKKDDGKVYFPWFTIESDGDEKAYCEFISAICNMAKEQHRIVNKPCVAENEKYAMRCFLLRMGFIGEEYKNTRKVLLRSLSGNSAFKNGKPGGDENEVSE